MISFIIKSILKIFFWIMIFFFFCLGLSFCSGNARAESNEDVRCLATTIYHEARGEPHKGQIAVAKVVMNRVNYKHEFPNRVCHVVKERNQFSWVNGKRYIPMKYTKKELDIARKVYYNSEDYNHIVNHDVLFFQMSYIKRNWATQNLVRTKVIGNHVFFKYPSAAKTKRKKVIAGR